MSFEKQPLCCGSSIHVAGEDGAFKYGMLPGELWEGLCAARVCGGCEWLK